VCVCVCVCVNYVHSYNRVLFDGILFMFNNYDLYYLLYCIFVLCLHKHLPALI